MHHLHRNKIILLVFIGFLFSTVAEAQIQPKGNYNFWEFRNKPFYFGLTVGTHSSGYITSNSSQFMNSDSITFAQSKTSPGFNVNIITNLKIGQYFDFRFSPGFAFSERSILFTQNTSIPERKNRIESVFLDIPVALRFKSSPYKDKRLFVIAGLKYSYDVQSNSRARQEIADQLFQVSAHDFQFEVGAGIQFFLPFFIFSPELKFSQGISNIHIHNPKLEDSRVLDKILSRALTISLHFEG